MCPRTRADTVSRVSSTVVNNGAMHGRLLRCLNMAFGISHLLLQNCEREAKQNTHMYTCSQTLLHDLLLTCLSPHRHKHTHVNTHTGECIHTVLQDLLLTCLFPAVNSMDWLLEGNVNLNQIVSKFLFSFSSF